MHQISPETKTINLKKEKEFQPRPQTKMAASRQYALPKGSLILVTAANSYIGSNIVDLLLQLGFRVRGTVRAEKPWLNELFENRHGKGRFETIVVPGAEMEGAFDNALHDISGVIHVVCTSRTWSGF